MQSINGYTEIEGASEIVPWGEWVKFTDANGHEIHIDPTTVLALHACALALEEKVNDTD